MESRSSLYLPLGRRSSNKAPSSAHMTELTNQLYLVGVKARWRSPITTPRKTPIKYSTVPAVRDHTGPCRRLVGTDGGRSCRTQISTDSSTESYKACMTECIAHDMNHTGRRRPGRNPKGCPRVPGALTYAACSMKGW